MLRVSIVSSSPILREALRQLLESREVRVVEAERAPEGPPPSFPVFLFGDRRDLAEWRDTARERQAAIVVMSDHELQDLVTELYGLDLRGWAVLPPESDADSLYAAVVAADQGFAVVPNEWLTEASAPAGFASGLSALDDGARTAPPLRGATGVGVRPRGRGELPESDDEESSPEEKLTARELEVLELLALGLSNREIATRLAISEHTAKFHVASILGKLGASNRADAVRRGFRRGLVSL